MRTFTAALCFVSLWMCTSASAQNNHLFRGTYSIVNKSAGCPASDPIIGDTGVIRLRVRTDGQGSSFALYDDGPTLAQAYRLTGDLFDATFQTVQAMRVTSRFLPLEDPVSVRFRRQTPATIVLSTRFLSLAWDIRGYGSVADCEVFLRAALVRNLD